jgi:predicted SnoaL-like aldol condensation-catalyzing enzyme
MPAEGTELGKAYFTVNLDDQTSADYEKIKAKLSAEKPLKFKTELEQPDFGPVRERTRNEEPLKIPVKADNPVDAAWKAQVEASLKATAREALKIPVTPESEMFKRDLARTIREAEQALHANIPADVADAAVFKAHVEELARSASEHTKVHIPVEVDHRALAQAISSIDDLGTESERTAARTSSAVSRTLSSVASASSMTTGAWVALGAVLAGPAIGAALAGVAGGFTLIGVLAEKSAPEVQTAFATMKTQGVDVFQQSFTSLIPVIVSGLNQWTSLLVKLGPQFQTISNEIAPGLGIVNAAVMQAAQISIPAMSAALTHATPVAQGLGSVITGAAQAVANFLNVAHFDVAAEGMTALGRDAAQLGGVLATLLNAVMPIGNAILSSVLPAVISLAGHLGGDLAPALHVVGAAIQMLAPLLDFMSGPTAAVLVGVAAFKLLQATTSGLLSVFNAASSSVATYAARLESMATGTATSARAVTVMTAAQKAQAVQTAQATLVTAQQASAQAANNLATLEAAAATEASSVTQGQLAAARAAATAATVAEAEATEVLTTAQRASSFAFGPVGVGLAAVAGLMTLFAGTTSDKATPAVQNFTAQLDRLAQAAPNAVSGIIASDPQLADFINKATAAGVSVDELTRALREGGAAQEGIVGKLSQARAAVGAGTVSVKDYRDAFGAARTTINESSLTIQAVSDKIGDNKEQLNKLSPALRAAVEKYRDIQGVLSSLDSQFQQNANVHSAAGAVVAQSVNLTADQMTSASQVADMFGVSLNDVVAAYKSLPGAGSAAAGSVEQVASAYISGKVSVDNARQSVVDYFTTLQKNADQASQAVVSANHSYQQSIASVADAQHAYAQSQQAVVTAERGVEAARRSVTDATHSYENAQHSVQQAAQGVVDAETGVASAERNLEKAQQSARQTQVALTQARKDAAEQLKSLHLQLNDQVVSEERARLKLFDQLRSSAGAGVTPDNAHAVLAQETTSSNEAVKKAALDLIEAQNALADTLNQGALLRDQVNKADKNGIDQAPGVIAAQDAVRNSQEQVNSAQQALAKAHDQVSSAVYSLQQAYYNLGKAQQGIVDAQANVIKAQDAVREAVYNEHRARVAVKDAIYNEHQALLALRGAQDAARTANDLNTHSLDLNTQAGRNNYAQLVQLFNTYPSWMDKNARFKKMIDDTASSFGISKDKAAEYLKSIDQIPKDFKYSVTSVASANFDELNRVYNDKFGGHIGPIATNVAHAYAEGGYTGQGGKYEPAGIVHKGEWVIPQEGVHPGTVPILEALTKGKVRGGDGASLPGYASGGYVGEALDYFLSGSGAAYQGVVNPLTVMGFPHPPGLPKYVAPVVDTSFSSAGSGVRGDRAANRNIVMSTFASMFGWSSAAEQAATDYLMMRESGYNNVAQNPTSTAYGMFQFLNSTWGGYGIAKTSDPGQQAIAGGRYIRARYGDPIGASMHERAANWYDQGGYMLNNPGINQTGKPEMVLPPTLTDTMNRLDRMVQAGSGGGVTINQHIVTEDPERAGHAAASRIAWDLRARH